jgi:YfiH family protein
MQKLHDDESYITFPIFDQFRELTCAFSTRVGGYSEAPFSSLNMGNMKFDNPDLVKKNRNLFLSSLGIEERRVAFPDQVHSATVNTITSAGIIPESDALITSQRGLFLAVQTADCFPLFIYAPSINTVAVIHAGWKGAIQNIVPKTLDLLERKYKANMNDLYVAIGPGLQTECFEVRSDVYMQFPENLLSTHEDHSKRNLNLSGYLIQQLLDRNIPENQIYGHNDCTKCNQDRYYSYRRDGEKTGRMMGIIGSH